jgi:DNA-binding MarR family transcriptional regulator
MPRRNGEGIDLLADPTRRRIVALLALATAKPMMGEPTRLAKELGLSRPATSRQLHILRKAGLIAVRRGWVDGRRRVYFIEPTRLGQIAAWLAGTELGRAFPASDRLFAPDGSDTSA